MPTYHKGFNVILLWHWLKFSMVDHFSVLQYHIEQGRKEGWKSYKADGRSYIKVREYRDGVYLRCKHFRKRCQGLAQICNGVFYQTRAHTCEPEPPKWRKKMKGLATLLEGAGCVLNISNISKNSKINYGVNEAVKLDNHGIYRQSPVKTPDINKHYSSNVNV